MPTINVMIQRCGIFAAFALVGYAFGDCAQAFGTVRAIGDGWGFLLVPVIYFVGYLLAIGPYVRWLNGFPAVRTRPYLAMVLAYIGLSTVLFDGAHEIVALLMPSALGIPSHVGLAFYLLSITTTVCGILMAMKHPVKVN